MKKFVLLLALSLLCVLPASAAVQEFDNVRVEVPEGWSTQVQGPMVMMTAPDMSEVFSVIVMPAQGSSAEEIARQTAGQIDGSSPVKEGDGYKINFDAQGRQGTSWIRVVNDQAIISTFAGDANKLMYIARSVVLK